MRLALVDDHPMLLDALSLAVESVGHTADCFDNLAPFDESVANGAQFDLVVLDLALPGYANLEALDYYREWHDDLPVVVMSANDDSRTIGGALSRGAMGFIPKKSTREELLMAIKFVADGGIYVPLEALPGVSLPAAREAAPAAASSSPVPVRPGETPARAKGNVVPGLTPRQHDVLDLLLKGMPNKLICRQLGLSPNTVKSHVSAIFRALDVDSRTKAVIAARDRGLGVDFSRARA